MSLSEGQKLLGRIQETIKQMDGGTGGRDEALALLKEAADRISAMEAAMKRLREEARGPAQEKWSKHFGDALNGYLVHPEIALTYSEADWDLVFDNCEDLAEKALERWKRRWIDGQLPARRRGPVEGAAKPAEAAAQAPVPDVDRIFDPEPAPPRQAGPRMVDAPQPAPQPAPPPPATPSPADQSVPAPAPDPPAPKPAPLKPAPPPPPAKRAPPPPPAKPAPPPQPRERQPGDD